LLSLCLLYKSCFIIFRVLPWLIFVLFDRARTRLSAGHKRGAPESNLQERLAGAMARSQREAVGWAKAAGRARRGVGHAALCPTCKVLLGLLEKARMVIVNVCLIAPVPD